MVRSPTSQEAHPAWRAHTDLTVGVLENGAAVGQLPDARITPTAFTLPALSSNEVSAGLTTAEWQVYRSALNADEVAYLYAGHTYQSSLEVWATLDHSVHTPAAARGVVDTTNITNLAQSMTEIKLESLNLS